jgi:phosphohistidine phosphatase
MNNVVYVVQHGEAKSKNEDAKRPLTSQGHRETERIAALAARLDLGIEEIRHSGKTRAEETAIIFGRAFGLMGDIMAIEGIDPTDNVKPVADSLAGETRAIMLVGHLPFMSRLAGQLVHGDIEKSPVEFRNSGIVCLVCAAEGWRVDWQLNPG